MGSITYLDELRSLCIALENGYWSLEEAEVLIQNIIGYWPVLHGKLDKNATRRKRCSATQDIRNLRFAL